MQPHIVEIFEFALLTMSSVFILVDPFAVISQFLVITSDSDESEQRHVARRAGRTCALILAGFAVAGSLVFRILGITLPAFKFAGGIILMQIGMDNLGPRRSTTKEAPEEAAEGASRRLMPGPYLLAFPCWLAPRRFRPRWCSLASRELGGSTLWRTRLS